MNLIKKISSPPRHVPLRDFIGPSFDSLCNCISLPVAGLTAAVIGPVRGKPFFPQGVPDWMEQKFNYECSHRPRKWDTSRWDWMAGLFFYFVSGNVTILFSKENGTCPFDIASEMDSKVVSMETLRREFTSQIIIDEFSNKFYLRFFNSFSSLGSCSKHSKAFQWALQNWTEAPGGAF